MDKVEFIDVFRDSVIVILLIACPVLIVAMLVGLIIAIFQALTTIQEMTLTFVPVIVAVFAAIIALLPFMMDVMVKFGQRVFDRILGFGVGIV